MSAIAVPSAAVFTTTGVADVTINSAVLTSVKSLGAFTIGGVVTGPKGPEAGVWVIAETRDLPVRFIRIVVTDDQTQQVLDANGVWGDRYVKVQRVPFGEWVPFRSFIEPIIEDILVLDAGSIEKERTLGGSVAYLHAVDGAKIKVNNALRRAIRAASAQLTSSQWSPCWTR